MTRTPWEQLLSDYWSRSMILPPPAPWLHQGRPVVVTPSQPPGDVYRPPREERETVRPKGGGRG